MTQRVLWLTPDKPDNISVGRQRIADHLEDRGFEVTIRGTTTGTVFSSLRERGRYDAIIGTTRAGAIAGIVLAAVHRCPFVVDHVDPIRQFEETHSQWLATVVRILESVTFWTANHVIYVYEEERNRVTQFATASTKTDLGVEYDRFADPDDEILTMAAKSLEVLNLRPNVAVYVGGLEPIYHIRSLLKSIELLDDWTLLVLGDGTLSNDVQRAEATRDDVVYLGTVPHKMVPGYLHAADVGVSLVDDPHTLKILEYAAAGLGIVQRAGRANNRFGDSITYCDASPESIATAIEQAGIQGSARELRSDVSTFDWSEIADDYAAVLTGIV